MSLHKVEHWLFGLYLAILLWAPLPLGSNREWSSCLLVALACGLGAVWLVLLALGGAQLTRPLRNSGWLIALWSVFIVYVFIQAMVPWPGAWLARSGEWQAAARLAGIPAVSTMSSDPAKTLSSAWLSLGLGLMFFLSLALVRSHQRLRVAGYALVIGGVIQSAYAIVSALGGGSIEIASGTYVNRNHFAGYLEMTLAMGIGMLAGGRRLSAKAHGWRDWLRSCIHFLLSEKSMLRIGVLIMALGLILSRSRMGNSAFMMSLTGVGLLYLLLSHGTFRLRLTLLWVSILALDIAMLGSYFGLRQLTERLEATTATEMDKRVDIGNLLYPYVQDFLPFGSGLGTFRRAFSPYYAEAFHAVYTDAEDDYLQFLGELGVGVLPLSLLVMSSLWVAIQALRRTEHIFIRGMSFAAVMAIVSLLIHSLVDFNLQIPANAAMFVFMLSTCWLIRYMPDEISDQMKTTTHSEENSREFGKSHRKGIRHRTRGLEITKDAVYV